MVRWLVAAIACALVVACGDLRGEVRSLAIITTGGTEVAAGRSTQWTAIATYYDGTEVDVTADAEWTTDNPSAARADEGRLVGVEPGEATITASHAELSRSVRVVVASAVLTGIGIEAVPPIPAGVVQQLAVTGMFSDGSTSDVTAQAAWSTGDPLAVDVSPTGIVRAVAIGSATISATVDGHAANREVTVSDATITTIAIAPGAATTLVAGRERGYSATGTFSDGSVLELTELVTWASDDPAVASVVAGGVVRGRTQGTATISAAFATGYGALQLQVTPPVVESLAIATGDVELPRAFAERVVAIGTYSNGARADLSDRVAWSTGNAAIAMVETSTVHGIAAGDTTVTATLGSLSSIANVRVTAAQLTSIAVTRVAASVPIDYGDDLVATGTFSDGSEEELSAQVSWSSSDPAVSVTPSGRVTATAAGLATITASHGSSMATVTITGVAATLTTLTLAPLDPVLVVGQAQQLTATGAFSDGQSYPLTDDVVWSTNLRAVATVDARGRLAAMGEGTTTVIARDLVSSKVAATSVRATLP